MISVQINNVNKVENYFIKLPSIISKNVGMSNLEFMKAVQKSAKLRAPKDTGSLAAEITILPMKSGKIQGYRLVSMAPYSYFQEFGFKPHYFFAGKEFNSSKLSPGRGYFVKKHKSFIQPSIEANLSNLNKFTNNAINKSIRG